MSLKLNPLNFKKNKSIWTTLQRELDKRLNSNIKIIFPEDWNNEYYKWFQEIEKHAFRDELRYSFKEVEDRLNNSNIFFSFILVNNKPEAFLLGYLYSNEQKGTFFLDTIAVKNHGKGIGTFILKSMIEWLREENYKIIRLDTEEIDEKKILLYKFYENLGFILEERDDKGNLSMILNL